MVEYSAQMKKKFHDLVRLAYEEELKRYLAPLNEHFKEWENNKTSSLNLTNIIHKFHNGISKKLFRIYNNLDSSLLTARAIALNLLSISELDQHMIDQLQPKIDFYRQELEDIEDDMDNEY